MKRDKWEYKVVDRNATMTEANLNKLGSQGWELVHMVAFSLKNLRQTSRWYFKRRK